MKPLNLILAAILMFLPVAHAQQEETVSLSYPNNPVTDILPLYERLTGKRLIKDSTLNGNPISLMVTEKVPRAEAIRLIEAVLLLNGYAIVPMEDNAVKVLNVQSGKNVRSEGVALYANPKSLPPGEQVVSYYMPLRYLPASDAVTVFTQHIAVHPVYGQVVPVPNTQAVLITENASIVRLLIKLQELIDVPPAKLVNEFVVLQRADAEKVVEIMTKLVENRKKNATAGAPGQPQPAQPNGAAGGAEASLNSDVQFVADTRTNRVLLVAPPTSAEYFRSLIRELDDAVTLAVPFERPLRYISATEVLPVIRTVLSETKEDSTGTTGAPANAQGNNQNANRAGGNNARSGSGATGGAASRPDVLGDQAQDDTPESIIVGKTRIIADPRANTILVIGPPESQAKVGAVLDKLDRRPMQVYLATVIGQLTLGDGMEFSVDLLQKFARAGDFGLASGLRNRTDAVPEPRTLRSSPVFPLPAGLTLYGMIGQQINAYVKALETSNRFQVISRPVIYTANNKKAVISSGQRIAVPTSTLSTLNTGVANQSSVTANIDYVDVVLKLEVLPLINSEREVTLQINQVNDSIVGSQTIGGNSVPTIGTQEVTTTVTVPNQGTVVLGGLTTDSNQRNGTGLPWLSRIPVIGYLFGGVIKANNRTELIILIQPTVIGAQEDVDNASNREIIRTKVGPQAAQTLQSTKVVPVKAVPVRPVKKVR